MEVDEPHDMFQFYLSSIKRGTQAASLLHPTLFQFYLSSIKSGIELGIVPQQLLFQFYLSSIKSKEEFPEAYDIMSFNSTLVQLKAGDSCIPF